MWFQFKEQNQSTIWECPTSPAQFLFKIMIWFFIYFRELQFKKSCLNKYTEVLNKYTEVYIFLSSTYLLFLLKKLVFGFVRICYEIGPDYWILNRTSIIFIKLELHRYAPLCNSQINVKTKASKNIIQSIHSLANL